MLQRVRKSRLLLMGLVLAFPMPVPAQAAPSALANSSLAEGYADDLPAVAHDAQMHTPPPVSGETYPTLTESETASDYLRAYLSFETSCDDNVRGISDNHSVSDVIYSVKSAISYDQISVRHHQAFTYNPGFTFYQRTGALNAAEQNASGDIQYRPSPHTAFGLEDRFQQSSNVFNQPGTGVSGSAPSSLASALVPYINRTGNTANVEFNYQYALNAMVGASGSSLVLHYPRDSQAGELPNENERMGSVFYNRRLPREQYLGEIYQYSDMIERSATGHSVTHLQTFYIFYTFYPSSAVSFSVSGGPQYASIVQSSLPPSHRWGPALMASMGWQSNHIATAANYSRTVTGIGGLLGSFHSDTAGASLRQQLGRAWIIDLGATYVIQDNLLSESSASDAGGRSLMWTASLEHPLGNLLIARTGYTRLHQNYDGVAALSGISDSDRAFVSISYTLTRTLVR